jgi:hypothetical protein
MTVSLDCYNSISAQVGCQELGTFVYTLLLSNTEKHNDSKYGFYNSKNRKEVRKADTIAERISDWKGT